MWIGRPWKGLRVGFALLATAAVIGLLWHHNEKGWTERKVERMINAALPVGSSRLDVENWLTRQAIGFSYKDTPKQHPKQTFETTCLLADWSYSKPESIG